MPQEALSTLVCYVISVLPLMRSASRSEGGVIESIQLVTDIRMGVVPTICYSHMRGGYLKKDPFGLSLLSLATRQLMKPSATKGWQDEGVLG
jgi:hypothetical protein